MWQYITIQYQFQDFSHVTDFEYYLQANGILKFFAVCDKKNQNPLAFRLIARCNT